MALVPESSRVVVLDVLVVTDSSVKAAFSEQIETQPQRLMEEVLFWKGRSIASKNFGGVRAVFGTWFEFGEKATGVKPSLDIYLKVELFRFQW
jgi:hypothetical protein